MGLSLSFEVLVFFLNVGDVLYQKEVLNREVLNQKEKLCFQYKNLCFHDNTGQTFLSFLSEFLLEYHFAVLSLWFVHYQSLIRYFSWKKSKFLILLMPEY